MDKVAIYRGRIVEKEHFRAFVYDVAGNQMLVESWPEFEAAMASGLWFDTPENAQDAAIKPKPRRQKVKTVSSDEPVDELVVDGVTE